MQISPIKNPNFEKPSRNLSTRTKVKILKKKIFGYLSKKIWFRVCSHCKSEAFGKHFYQVYGTLQSAMVPCSRNIIKKA